MHRTESVRLHPIAVISCVLFLLAVVSLPAQEASSSKRLIGYYPEWSKTNTPSYSAKQIPYARLTHINHAFALISYKLDGSIQIPVGMIEPELISRAHAAGVKVLISIGGGDGVEGPRFNKIARSEATRQVFAANVTALLQEYGYDGVDIDWEVPYAKDTQNCTTLMQELRSALPSPWLISMASPSDPPSYGQGFDIPALTPIVDFFNVMTYDYYGPWSGATGHVAPLLQSAADPQQVGSVKDSMDLYANTYGVPPQQLNFGMPFYGYEFDGTDQLWQTCTACTATSQNYGPYIKDLLSQPGWTGMFDPEAQAPYLVNRTTPSFLTYDNPASIYRKSHYALKARGFGGIFMWELSADYDGKSQDLLGEMYKAKQAAK
jgi:chitinase